MKRLALAWILALACGPCLGAAESSEGAIRIEQVDFEPSLETRGSLRLPRGQIIVLEPGQGERWSCVVRIENGQRRVMKKVKRLRRGLPLRVMIGKGKQESAQKLPNFTRALRELTMTATAYDPGPDSNGLANAGNTSSGERTRLGVVAVDTNVIKLGNLLYIEGYGPGKALDRGGGIKGRRIDLCFNSSREALQYGRKKTRLWVLGYLPRSQAKVLEARLRQAQLWVGP